MRENNNKQLDSEYVSKEEPIEYVLTEVWDEAKIFASATKKGVWFTKMRKTAEKENMREKYQEFSFGKVNSEMLLDILVCVFYCAIHLEPTPNKQISLVLFLLNGSNKAVEGN